MTNLTVSIWHSSNSQLLVHQQYTASSQSTLPSNKFKQDQQDQRRSLRSLTSPPTPLKIINWSTCYTHARATRLYQLTRLRALGHLDDVGSGHRWSSRQIASFRCEMGCERCCEISVTRLFQIGNEKWKRFVICQLVQWDGLRREMWLTWEHDLVGRIELGGTGYQTHRDREVQLSLHSTPVCCGILRDSQACLRASGLRIRLLYTFFFFFFLVW